MDPDSEAKEGGSGSWVLVLALPVTAGDPPEEVTLSSHEFSCAVPFLRSK